MKRLLILACALLSLTAAAAKPKTEIEYLLNYLAKSDCQYIRNGKTHAATDAVEHIRKKYAYFEDDIDSTEKFIELSATGSSMTGKPYKVLCPGQPEENSADWLLNALQNYRSPPLSAL
jgi:hypothetical protein